MARTTVKLNLRRKIWNSQVRTSILNKTLTELSEILENRIKSVIDDSTPAGRIYRVGSQTTRRTKTTSHLPKARGRSTRVVVTGKFHQASAYGQPPAKFTLTLYKSIKVRKIPGKLSILASVNAPGVDVLDDPAKLSRLFFRTTIETFYAVDFNDQARQSIKELLS